MTDTASASATHHVPADLPDRIQHYIDGEFVDSVDGDTFDVLDPVSNETYLQAAAGKKADIDRAVAAARRAFTDGPVAPDAAARALARPAPHRRHRRVARRPARRARVASTPACRSRRRSARRGARPRTSGSSPT